MTDTKKFGILILLITIIALCMSGKEEYKEYQLSQCLKGTDYTDTSCDSCYDSIYK